MRHRTLITCLAALGFAFLSACGSPADTGSDVDATTLPDTAQPDAHDVLDILDNPDTGTDTTEIPRDTADPDAADADDVPDDGPRPPLAVPYVTPPWAEPAIDRTYLQEDNSNPLLDAGFGPLMAVLLPPAGSDLRETPVRISARGIVERDIDGIDRVLAIPDEDPDLVGAVFLGDDLILAGPSQLYRHHSGTTQLAATFPGRDIKGISRLGDHLILRSIGFWAYGLEPGLISWFELDPATTLTAVAQGAAGVESMAFFALSTPSHSGQPDVTLAGYSWPPSGPLEDDPLALRLPPETSLAIGSIRALVANVTLPEPLDLVAIGDNGIQGFRIAWGSWHLVPVEVPLFAQGRVPLDQPTGAARASDGGFIVTTLGGAYRVVDRDIGPEWRVYNANRWVPSGDVRSAATDPDVPDGPIWFATAAGMSRVTSRRITLEDKMGDLVERIVLRHDRDGAVADSRLTVPGDLSTNIPWDSDNDGGWTCYWILSECFRWKATADPQAKAHFDKSLERMLSFRTLTGTDWFLARSVIHIPTCNLDDCDDPDDGEWFKSQDGQWWIKSDTSNDEVTSHMFMMGHAHDLCADADQKAAIVEHVRGIVGGLVDHDFLLLKPDGTPTRYGQFDPNYVNGVVGLMADGGRRSVQMLGALNLALYLTGDPKFAEAKRYLIEEHHYHTNVVTESEPPGRVGSGDGDELATQAFFALMRYETDPDLYDMWRDGWLRSYGNMRLQQSGLWDVINGVLGGDDPDFFNTIRFLRLQPTDGIRWNLHNIHRKDLALPPAYYRKGEDRWARSDGYIIPPDERPNHRHNTSQYQCEGGWGDNTEIDGAEILATYWMARYHGFIAVE
jgi:hypothetical protein